MNDDDAIKNRPGAARQLSAELSALRRTLRLLATEEKQLLRRLATLEGAAPDEKRPASDDPFRPLLEGKTILITGGTGYLGRALTRRLLRYQPQSIRLFSRDEVKHHAVQEEFGSGSAIRTLVGDVRDYQRLVKATRNADIVIHAAALKRLDLMEYNVEEAIHTNIIGTLNVVNACLHSGVEKAVMVSTDKACSPVNTYGACKFVSERIFSESNYNKGNLPTVFTTVRYGNVLESTGSVIPFFSKKILAGAPVPLTDSRMTRFIITPDQAVNLIFKSLEHGIGGEVFVPKLPAFTITDLIEILMTKFEKRPPIEVVGVRPGEKLHELMVNDTEMPRTYEYDGLYVINSCIENFLDVEPPVYVKKGKRLADSSTMTSYGSNDAVVPRADVERVLREVGLV